jgi:hypothetical protein
VQFDLTGIGADLHARDDGHPTPRPGLDRLVDPLHGVVVGQRDQSEPALVSQPHDLRRRVQPVRDGAVHVQIETPGGSCSRPA